MSASETAWLRSARGGDQQAFAELAGPYRRELLAHCYRLLGSLHDAEDLVQETLLRAWRRLDTYEGRASFRAWLYKIATHACLDALGSRSHRASARAVSLARVVGEQAEPRWVDPYPDALVAGAESDPAARYDQRESVSLAFLTILQTLPPRQRAVLLLRDVLGMQASEAAALLEQTVPSVNSALHRARSTLGAGYAPRQAQPAQPDTATRALLERYVRAWESDDLAGMIALLREEAVLSMPPMPLVVRGSAAIRAFLGSEVRLGSQPGRWRLLLTAGSGQPAVAFYHREADEGPYAAYALQLLRLDGGRIVDMVTYLDPRLPPRFGLPDAIPADGAGPAVG